MTTPFTWRGRAVRGVLLDMDGTIVDTRDAHADAWVDWARRRGVPITREEYLTVRFGRSNSDFMPEIMPELAHDPEALRELAMERERVFLATLMESKPVMMPGLAEFLDRAEARGIKLAIASSAPRENVEAIAEYFGLAKRVAVRLSMDDVERAKPAPDLFLGAATGIGIDPAECVVFEDSRFGLEAGRAAGAATVAILSLHDENELAGMADLCVADFNDLLARNDWRGF